MDYKYIEQLLERYWAAETTLEEERILHAFFSQEDIPADMEEWRPLFVTDTEEPLGDDFDARIMAMIQEESKPQPVKAQRVSLSQRLMPLFKAAAVVAIILTLGGALQAPWDSAWDTSADYAAGLQQDTITEVIPIQAENIGDAIADSTQVLMPNQSKN